MSANLLNGLSLTVIAEESLPVLQAMVPMLTAFNTDFSSEIGAAGTAVSTRYPAAKTAKKYTRAGGYANSDASASAVTITLGEPRYSFSSFTDSEVSTIGVNKLMNTFLAADMYAVVNGIYSDAVANITYANAGSASVTSSVASFNFNSYVTALNALKTAGVSSAKSVVLNSNYYGAVLNDIKANYVLGTPDAIRTGVIGNLAGASLFESPGLASNSESLVGFACGKEALTIATRLPVAANATMVEMQTITEPTSGLTLQLRRWYSPDNGLLNIGFFVMAGVSLGNASAIKRITDGTRW